MPLIQIETPFNIELEFEIAEAYKRLFAYLVDFAILLVFFISMKYFYYGGFNLAGAESLKSHVGLDILTISIPMLLYSLVCEVMMHGQTVGKKIFNIRIISVAGGEPSLSQYTTRWIFKVFEWPFFFGYTFFSLQNIAAYILLTGFWGMVVLIFIAVSKKNQRLGDIAANTVVINTSNYYFASLVNFYCGYLESPLGNKTFSGALFNSANVLFMISVRNRDAFFGETR